MTQKWPRKVRNPVTNDKYHQQQDSFRGHFYRRYLSSNRFVRYFLMTGFRNNLSIAKC